MKKQITIRIRPHKARGDKDYYSYDFLFTDHKGKVFVEVEAKRYLRVLSRVKDIKEV